MRDCTAVTPEFEGDAAASDARLLWAVPRGVDALGWASSVGEVDRHIRSKLRAGDARPPELHVGAEPLRPEPTAWPMRRRVNGSGAPSACIRSFLTASPAPTARGRAAKGGYGEVTALGAQGGGWDVTNRAVRPSLADRAAGTLTLRVPRAGSVRGRALGTVQDGAGRLRPGFRMAAPCGIRVGGEPAPVLGRDQRRDSLSELALTSGAGGHRGQRPGGTPCSPRAWPPRGWSSLAANSGVIA
jgi:hypothetical protein